MEEPAETVRIMVVYYSRFGTIKDLAGEIAAGARSRRSRSSCCPSTSGRWTSRGRARARTTRAAGARPCSTT
ncbi:MAG TPA: hypothetical protein VFL91_04670 [Thermomicrobiales bacterium]|nr:hypothetical protein [Thermomicrobiales bacterium]